MKLKLCYECSNQVSRKALICPNCGVPLKKGPLSKKTVSSLAFIYSIIFWYFFHPLWTEKWVDMTRGVWISTSNFICGLIFMGGLFLWNRLYPPSRY
jgi:hypothetical protein|tara:strand:+ start:325 stop:615 length:291 start_codon:yes stop_codon:yes gene_type:complete